jgi:THO complex subunit 3
MLLDRQRPELTELRNHFKKNKKIREYNAHSYKVHSVGWSCDGKRLASGSFDKSVSVFTLDRERLVKINFDKKHDVHFD